jgi:hypothetical protein
LFFLFASAAAISFGLIGEDLRYQLSIGGCCIRGSSRGLVAVGCSSLSNAPCGNLYGALLYLMILMAGAVFYGSFGPEEGVRSSVRRFMAAEPCPVSLARVLRKESAEVIISRYCLGDIIHIACK